MEMSKEKQIEEMATTLCHQRNIVKSLLARKCNDCPAETCDIYEICEDLYNAGYRKRSENVIELPCRIGDKVWAIRKYNGIPHAREGIVGDMSYLHDMRLSISVRGVARGVWGEKVFATQEECERAING